MIERIDNVMSIRHQGVEYYSTLPRPLEHYEKGIFVIEGDKVVKRFIESQLKFVSVLLTQDMLEVYRENIEKRTEAVSVYIAKKEYPRFKLKLISIPIISRLLNRFLLLTDRKILYSN